MAYSVFHVVVVAGGSPVQRMVMAQAAGGLSAMQVAIHAGRVEAGEGSALQGASEIDGRAVDIVAAAAVSPAVDVEPRKLYRVQFRPGTGPGGSTVAPRLVVASARESGGGVTSGEDVALAAAVEDLEGAVANGINVVGTVDLVA